MKVVKITFENDHGKYKLYTTEENILDILKHESFTNKIVDAKTGEVIVHSDKIIEALKIESEK